ncbi:MAG: cobalamin-binding protein [Planctomycetes bacterium]|nr:cobalamin-binding protein [Planctomycetota bacterium]
MSLDYPQRVVCLTEETTEVLYRIGAGDLVVGVSGFTVRPPEAREKPKISRFLDADTAEIEALKPDLVLAFSDLQVDIVRELGKHGLDVMLFNQRSVAEILRAIRMIGALVGRHAAAEALAEELAAKIETVSARPITRRPRVWLEEWPDPLISGIQWFSELVEIAGAQPLFPERALQQGALGRTVSPDEVRAANPEAIIGSWCGKMVKPTKIREREGWHEVPAVREDHIYEVPSALILQPGPAALDEGLDHLVSIVDSILAGKPNLPPLGPRRARGVPMCNT